MKTLFILFLIGLRLGSASTADTFASANESYNKRDFGAAISSYETLIRRDENRPEIFYNLGLAYEKSANPAKAILQFERALILEPTLSDAQTHLENLSGVPSQWWERLPPFLRLGLRASVLSGVAALWVFLLAGVAAWRVLGNTKLPWQMTQVLAALVFSIAALSFWLRDYPLASPNRAIVLKPESLRSNFTSTSPSILGLKPGQTVEITSVNGPWTECRLPDQTTGWVASPSLERVIPSS